MLQIPNDIENLEKQKFDLEGKSYTFYTPDYDTDISPENIEFLKDQSEDILSLFLSYIDSNRGLFLISSLQKIKKQSLPIVIYLRIKLI